MCCSKDLEGWSAMMQAAALCTNSCLLIVSITPAKVPQQAYFVAASIVCYLLPTSTSAIFCFAVACCHYCPDL